MTESPWLKSKEYLAYKWYIAISGTAEVQGESTWAKSFEYWLWMIAVEYGSTATSWHMPANYWLFQIYQLIAATPIIVVSGQVQWQKPEEYWASLIYAEYTSATIDGWHKSIEYWLYQLSQNVPIVSSLLTGLRGYWKLDEASGVRASQVNGLTLTDNNTVGSAAGKISNAASFVAASSEYLSIADNALLSFSGSYTISAWCYIDPVPAGFAAIVGKDVGAIGVSEEYAIVYSGSAGSNRLVFYHFGALGSVNIEDGTGAPPGATWLHVIAWYDSSGTPSINIQRNNGTIYTNSTAVPAPISGTAPFALGARGDGVVLWDGRIDEVGLWDRILTTPERAQLYNSGAGVTYPTFA